jgi:hypothetical protein
MLFKAGVTTRDQGHIRSGIYGSELRISWVKIFGLKKKIEFKFTINLLNTFVSLPLQSLLQ